MTTTIVDSFNRKWAENSTITPWATSQYQAGWAVVGDTPPTVAQFDAVLNELDEKNRWLFRQVQAVATARGVTLEDATSNVLADIIIDLSNSVNSTDTDTAASSLAVKKAYDKAIEALNASKSVIYDPTRRYLAGEIVFICDDPSQPHIGNWYEAYHPDGCLGKDPHDPVNRPDGWTNTDPAAPYYWLKHGKFIRPGTIGTIEMWETENLPQNRIPRMAVPLNASKFWRLAEVHANYVSGGNIILPDDVRGQFPRFKGSSAGVGAGRVINTLQGDAIRNITGVGDVLTPAAVRSPDNSCLFTAAGETGALGHHTTWASFGGAGVFFDASRVVPTAAENRPVNTAKLAAIPF